MVYEKDLDVRNRSPCSVASDDSNSSHSMLLRSSCRTSKCSAGEHCVSHTRQQRSINVELSALQIFVNSDNLATSSVPACTQGFFKLDNEQNKSAISGVTNSEKKVTWVDNKNTKLQSERCDTASITTTESHAHHSIIIASSRRDTKASMFGSSAEVNGSTMARTVYKRNALARILRSSESADRACRSLSSTSCNSQRSRNHHHNGSQIHQSFSQSSTNFHQRLHENDMLSVSGTSSADGRYSQKSSATHSVLEDSEEYFDDDDEEEDVTSTEQPSFGPIENQTGVLWSFFSWRKYLYFGLSKPTHYDVEILARIATYGKAKTIALLFLPLLLMLITSLFWNENLFPLQANDAECQRNGCHSVPKWWSLKQLFSNLYPLMALTSEQCDNSHPHGNEEEKLILEENQKMAGAIKSTFETNTTMELNEKLNSNIKMMTKAEMKMLVQEIIREEVVPQILMEKIKSDEITESEIERIQKEVNDFSLKLETFSGLLQSVKEEKSAKEFEMSSKLLEENAQKSHQLHEISDRLRKLENQFIALNLVLAKTKNCCMNGTEIEEKFAATLLSLMNSSNPALIPFKDWLSSKYISKQYLHNELKNFQELTKNQGESTKAAVRKFIEEHIETVRVELATQLAKLDHSNRSGTSLSASAVESIIKEALMLYDADKTNQTDYALESGGGAVVNTRCSETYNEGRPSVLIFGVPLWNLKSSPRNAIQPDVHPGQCWAFKGSQGFLVIELSATIRPTSFVIEHIPKSLSPTGSIDSAPKDFSVWGLTSEKDNDGTLLGEYTYDKDGTPLQHFPVQVDDGSSYPFVELQIHSNHGDLKYTCLYRFRVHGIRI